MEPSSAQLSGLKGETRIEEPDRAQRAIARRTAQTRATVPDLELETQFDVGPALVLAAQAGVSLTAILVRACALALRACPRANAAYRDGRYELYSRVNIGVVIPAQDASVTPTVLDADTKSLAALHQELETLRRRAETGELTPPELAGATFTLSDLSHSGVDRWSSLVNPPQAAALTAGAVRAAPLLKNGGLVPGHAMTLTLACDHRILFGTQAAGYLTGVTERLERGRL